MDKIYKESLNQQISSAETKRDTSSPLPDNQYYKESDGFFSYFVNKKTGEKKFKLDKNDVCVERNMDDFCR